MDTNLRDKIGDMIAYEKHSGVGEGLEGDSKPKNHFHELQEKQKAAQKEFHSKLFNELQKEVVLVTQSLTQCPEVARLNFCSGEIANSLPFFLLLFCLILNCVQQ